MAGENAGDLRAQILAAHPLYFMNEAGIWRCDADGRLSKLFAERIVIASGTAGLPVPMRETEEVFIRNVSTEEIEATIAEGNRFAAWREKIADDLYRKMFGPPAEAALMAEREVGRDRVGIERTPGGRVVVTIKPKDFAAGGASDAILERSRGDDGSVTIVVTPRDATPEPTAPAED